MKKTNKAKKSYDEIIAILDRSGSMAHMAEEAIAGLNNFVLKQKELDKPAKLTVIIFDNEYDILLDCVDLESIPNDFFNKENYVPRGMTALHDAIGKTIKFTEERLNKTKNKPDKIIVAILTDGLENASQEYKKSHIVDMVERNQKIGWNFIYLAANQDAFAEAKSYGIDLQYVSQYKDTGNLIISGFNCMSITANTIRSNDFHTGSITNEPHN